MRCGGTRVMVYTGMVRTRALHHDHRPVPNTTAVTPLSVTPLSVTPVSDTPLSVTPVSDTPLSDTPLSVQSVTARCRYSQSQPGAGTVSHSPATSKTTAGHHHYRSRSPQFSKFSKIIRNSSKISKFSKFIRKFIENRQN